jgi:D-psicose/D-tagatose/L-ribulose 3-epimerase
MPGWELGLIDSVWQGSEHDGLPGHTLAREIGYDSLDLFVGFDPGSDLPRRQKVIDDARASGLPVRSLIATCLGLNDFNTAVREFAIRRACNVVDLAAEFETARNLLFVPGEYLFQRRLLPPEQEWARVVDATRRVGGHAAGRGLEVAIELLPFEHAFIRTLDDLGRLLAEVDLPNVKAAIDISHLWLERIDPSALAGFRGRIAHVHIADCDGQNHGDLPPGRGTTPFPAYLSALREAGFEGTAAVELEFPVDGAPLRDWVTEAYGTSSRLLADAGVRS